MACHGMMKIGFNEVNRQDAWLVEGGGNRDWQRQHELRRLVTYRDAYVKPRTSIGEKEIFVEDIFEKKM